MIKSSTKIFLLLFLFFNAANLSGQEKTHTYCVELGYSSLILPDKKVAFNYLNQLPIGFIRLSYIDSNDLLITLIAKRYENRIKDNQPVQDIGVMTENVQHGLDQSAEDHAYHQDRIQL